MRQVISHIDDIGCAHGTMTAMLELVDAGTVTSGSVMVPTPWFADVAGRAATRPDLDLGVHLTLTSESPTMRWPPVSTTDPGTGLTDPTGMMWPTVSELREHADPVAVEHELRTQIERALALGIDVTHLDHHMGAAVAPEFIDVTAGLARKYELPVLLPRELEYYVEVLHLEADDAAVIEPTRERLEAEGLAFPDRFLMGLTWRDEPDVEDVYRTILSDLEPGVTYLALHCATPGDIEVVHQKDARWRVGEYSLFADGEFRTHLDNTGIDLIGIRHLRDAIRGTDRPAGASES